MNPSKQRIEWDLEYLSVTGWARTRYERKLEIVHETGWVRLTPTMRYSETLQWTLMEGATITLNKQWVQLVHILHSEQREPKKHLKPGEESGREWEEKITVIEADQVLCSYHSKSCHANIRKIIFMVCYSINQRFPVLCDKLLPTNIYKCLHFIAKCNWQNYQINP